jgi:purine nucleoside permease
LFLVLLGRSIADEVNPSISPTVDHPLKVKVVVVAMFEVGADTGDVPGEFQFWIERRKLAHVISLPSVASKLLDHWDQYSVQILGSNSESSPSPKSN